MSIRDTFFEECEDLLEALTEGLEAMDNGACDTETVNAVFRAVHSIKGGAGAFGLDTVVDFAHKVETLLDEIRSDRQEVNEDLLHLLHKSSDKLSDLVEAARDELDVDVASVAAIVAELETYLDDEEIGDDEDFVFDALTLDIDDPADDGDEDTGGTAVFRIEFFPFETLFSNGHEPAFLFAALAELGDLEIELDQSAIPDFETHDPISPRLRWTLNLTTVDPETSVHEVFEFVEGLCELTITPIDNIASAKTTFDIDPAPPLDEPEIEQEAVAASAVENTTKATPSQKPAQEAQPPRPTLRVDLERVDRLINTAGELIINQAMMAQHIEAMDLPAGAELYNNLEDYKLLAREIQEGVMAIRAQPVKPLFQRMSRIVREASDATGKQAKLTMVGETTEVDKTVIERLADPLTHMIRNAVDHGLETPDVREQAGKSEKGEVRLSASHRSGSVLIEITDDGAGLDREKIKKIAIEKKLIPANVDLSVSEIENLLFLPGFSTATEVSNLSGRGVGMDVVRNAVQTLGGRVSISSVPGKGSTFSVVLPLTLAVMDGIVVSVAGQTMVVPVTSILESIRPTEADIHELGSEDRLLSIRGSYLPVIDIASKLGLAPPPGSSEADVLLLVETENLGECALAVDAIHDHRQVVIKSVQGNYEAIPGVSAATILGDGKIALILDPDGIARIDPPPASTSGWLNDNAEVRNA